MSRGGGVPLETQRESDDSVGIAPTATPLVSMEENVDDFDLLAEDKHAYWQADLDEAARRLTWLIREYRPDVVTTYNKFGGYGHPDHIRTHDVAIRAFARAGDPKWYPEQVASEYGGSGPSATDGGLEPWAPRKLYEQAIPASVREAMNERLAALAMVPQNQFRPQLFTFMLLAATLALLVRDNYRGRAPLWLVVPIMMLWGNLHGGFIIGIIQQLSDSRIGGDKTPIIVFAYLILIMTFRPQGLIGEETREAG